MFSDVYNQVLYITEGSVLLQKVEAQAFTRATIDRKGHNLLLSQSKLFSPLRFACGTVVISALVEHITPTSSLD